MLADQTKILLIEDNPAHARLVKEICLDCDTIEWDIQCASTLESGLNHLRNGDISGILLDLNLPDSQGIETLTCVDSKFPEIPIIVLTGQEDEAIAVEAVKQGAQDYLLKGFVDGYQLVRAIRHAIERKRMAVDLIRARDELEKRVNERTWELSISNRELEKQILERQLAAEELKKSEERFRAIFERAKDFIFIKDLSLRYTHVNPAMTKLWGVQLSEMLGKTAADMFNKESAESISQADNRALKGDSVEEIATREIRGVPMTLHEIRVPMYDGSGNIIGICGICRDVTDLNSIQVPKKFDSEEYRSEVMKEVLKQAAFAATTKSIILILGESGAGKDFLARYIHERSDYSSGPYFSINCAAVPSELAESELFGHEAGAFTGAIRRKRGLLELAEGGTLLLNEIGELSTALQAKLLSFLDTRTFTRVGGQQKITVNARLLAATNRDLQQEILAGHFRADLYYRLNVLSIRIPPLRQRMDDLPILVDHILSSLAKELQLSYTPELAVGELEKLCKYHWPGNVRELRNVLERAMILSGGGKLRVDVDVSTPRHELVSPSLSNIHGTATLADSMDNLSRAMIEEALTRSKGRKELAASYLGVSRYTLRRWIQKLGIDVRR